MDWLAAHDLPNWAYLLTWLMLCVALVVAALLRRWLNEVSSTAEEALTTLRLERAIWQRS